MDPEEPKEKPDLVFAKIAKQDLSTLSIDELRERIANMTAEIARCEVLISAKTNTRDAAEKLFKF